MRAWLAAPLKAPAVALLMLCSFAALAQVPVPALQSPVTDLTATLTAEQIASLDRRLREYEARKGSQIAVLLVPTTMPETIEQYSIRVVEQWQLGRKGVSDGVLLLVAKNDRAVRIEVGYGLEGALPDVIANRITDQVIVPRFRDGDFFGGISEGLERITAVIEGEPLPEAAPRERSSSERRGIGSALPLLFMLVFVGAGILRRMFGSLGGSALTAGAAGVLVWVLTSGIAIAAGAAVIAFLLALFTGGGGGGGWTSSRRRRGLGTMAGWGALGGRGGFGGGGFGGGGFGGGGWGGGGGGFGGGGASGRW